MLNGQKPDPSSNDHIQSDRPFSAQSPFITLPTYNENENIQLLLNEILEIDPRYQIIVIDDNSPDGTHETVRRLSETNSRIHLIHRLTERGRGSAGITGFQKAIGLGADAVVEMDADFSHQPRYLPILIGHLADHDLVIGSRSVEGGSEQGRSPVRRWITKMASLLIRTWLRVPVKDPTSGFRAFRVEALKQIPLDRIISTGPSIVEELLYYSARLHFRIKEISIVFEERHAGTSTLNTRILLQTLLFVLLLPFRIKINPR
ncbi:polyprenol monophosphomannose synthase [bacterium]|nr:polyprenol monophosphomannose synthase [bacterium]